MVGYLGKEQITLISCQKKGNRRKVPKKLLKTETAAVNYTGRERPQLQEGIRGRSEQKLTGKRERT